jgi:hypothetical protein
MAYASFGTHFFSCRTHTILLFYHNRIAIKGVVRNPGIKWVYKMPEKRLPGQEKKVYKKECAGKTAKQKETKTKWTA